MKSISVFEVDGSEIFGLVRCDAE